MGDCPQFADTMFVIIAVKKGALMATDAFAQTRRSDGSVPIDEVQPVSYEGLACDPSHMASLRFSPLAPTKVDRFGQATATDAIRGRAAMTLVDFSACASVRAANNADTAAAGDAPTMQLQVKGSELCRFAQAHGPLFAREPYAWDTLGQNLAAGEPFEEDVFLWGSAAGMANLAVKAQECVNGSLPLMAARNMLGLALRRVSNDTESSFDLLIAARTVSADYLEWLGAPRFIRREEAGGRINYSFVLGQASPQDGTAELQVALASFEHEITAADYRLLSQALDLSDAVDREARERLQLDADTDDDAAPAKQEESAYRLSDDQLRGFDAELTEDDLPQLASMVRALVAAHLTDAYVDVFSASGATGYLSFRSYLSWLWYDFSCNLGAVRVKYCMRCGRAYSVAGRRGPEKNYCSTDCRDAAHNERVGARRDELRQAFLAGGATVAQLAAEHYPDDDATTGAKRVRSVLQSWPALKHALDDDIAANGWKCPLMVRCHDEGLDVLKLLSTKRRTELKASRSKR